MTNKETLEEAFKNTYLGDKISFNSDIGKAFELGYNLSKEQDKNKYSEEDMKHAFFSGCQSERQVKPRVKCWEEFIEQFKKK